MFIKTVDEVVSLDSFKSHITCSYISKLCNIASEKNLKYFCCFPELLSAEAQKLWILMKKGFVGRP